MVSSICIPIVRGSNVIFTPAPNWEAEVQHSNHVGDGDYDDVISHDVDEAQLEVDAGDIEFAAIDM